MIRKLSILNHVAKNTLKGDSKGHVQVGQFHVEWKQSR